MNITIVMGPWLPVPPVRGGAMPKAWYGIAREFARLGHRVSILARKFPGQRESEVTGELSFLRTRGFAQGRFLAVDLAKDLLYALNVFARLPKADILVTNDFWVPALTGLFRRSTGAVVICAARFPKGQYRLYRRAARVIAISRAVRSAIVGEQPQMERRTIVIPLPIDVDALACKNRSRGTQERTLLFVGRVHPEKGIELLLRAFAIIATRFPEWRLKIVGPVDEADGGGGSQFDGRIRALAEGLNVEFPGPVFDAAVLAAEYRNADLFCYPSLADRGEAFGVAPLESMAAGVPPIVSTLECFRDFICDGENGWVFDHRAGNADVKLAEVLARAMLDEDARTRLGRRASVDARRFSFGAVARRYLDEFEGMLAAGRNGTNG